jgi:hypothetical protein
MQTPPGARTERLVVVPEADRVVRLPREAFRRSTVFAAVALVAAAAIVATAFVTYAVEHGQVSSAQRASIAAQNAAKAAEANANAEVADLQAQTRTTVDSLKARIASLEDAATSARTGAALETGAQKEAQRLVDALRQRLVATRSMISSVTGPPLANGIYVGLIDAVGAQQSPQMVIVDPVHLFAGEAATKAAVHDGFIGPGGTLPHGRYLRNATTAWRILPVSPTAQLVLRGWRGSASTRVTVSKLEQVFTSDLGADQKVTRDPFVVELSGGQITALREVLYP